MAAAQGPAENDGARQAFLGGVVIVLLSPPVRGVGSPKEYMKHAADDS